LEAITSFFSFMLHVDRELAMLVSQYGVYIYAILFFIIFGETGFVVLPFLPGDSLLFIAGALAADGLMDPWLLTFLLMAAAILGNTVNYMIGRMIGKKAYEMDSRWFNRNALLKTHEFYEKHGGKAIVLARFLPLVRTFAPFVAGVSEMSVIKFQRYNFLGAFLWIVLFVWGGYFFGQAEFTLFDKHIAIKDYLSTIALVGFAAALIPAVLGFAWQLMRSRKKAD
jgi:membrane-associated protein